MSAEKATYKYIEWKNTAILMLKKKANFCYVTQYGSAGQ